MGSITGSVIAAVLLALLTTFLQAFTEIRMILYAALLVIIMIFRPKGIMGTKEITDLFSIKMWKKDGRIQ
jgi:branched-chain amino acid transport system permease protein